MCMYTYSYLQVVPIFLHTQHSCYPVYVDVKKCASRTDHTKLKVFVLSFEFLFEKKKLGSFKKNLFSVLLMMFLSQNIVMFYIKYFLKVHPNFLNLRKHEFN